MDSLSLMLNRLRPQSDDFLDRFIQITSIYNAEFDSDNIIEFLEEGILRQEKKDNGLIYIPNIYFNNKLKEYIMPTTIFIRHDIYSDDIEIPIPETIEELRSMCKSNGIKIRLNNKTAQKLFA